MGASFLGQKRPRPFLFLFILAAHLAAILWLATRPVERSTAKRSGVVLALTSIAAESPPSRPPPRPLERQPITPRVRIPSVLVASTVEPLPAPSNAGPGIPGQCQIADDTTAAILADPAAMAELAALPRQTRTEADAVMLWNGEWRLPPAFPGPGSGPGAPLVGTTTHLQRVVVEVINAADPACRDALIAGPVFIPVPEGQRTTILAVGSGAWRWSELLEASRTCEQEQSASCVPTAITL